VPVWSAGFQPSGIEPDDYQVNFTEDRAEFTRRDGTLSTTLDVLVSPEDDAEVRRVSITNNGSRKDHRRHLIRRTCSRGAGR
jgi:cyclic beta-1,2-glucan synthetase